MPLTDELGSMVLERLASDGAEPRERPYNGHRFESWLSRLAEPQPDLTHVENLRNRELFQRVSEAVREVVLECQLKVLRGEPEWWLQRLVGVLHYSNSTALTFNYDTLVESAIECGWLGDDEHHLVHADDALRDMPPLAQPRPGGLAWPSPRASTFRLIKLHGSIDTFWVPGDETGSSIRRWSSGAAWGRPVEASSKLRRQVLFGREPFIVPPAAAKSAFYQNPLTRELWRAAADTIEESDEVALVGYSLPMTDLVASGMLAERLARNDAKVIVVNPDPGPVRAALVELGIEDQRISEVGGADACAQYVAALEESFTPELHWPEASELPVVVGRRSHREFPVLALAGETSPGTVTLRAGEREEHPNLPATGPTLRDVLAGGENIQRLRVEYNDGKAAYVAQIRPGADPSGSISCLVLVPTAVPFAMPKAHGS